MIHYKYTNIVTSVHNEHHPMNMLYTHETVNCVLLQVKRALLMCSEINNNGGKSDPNAHFHATRCRSINIYAVKTLTQKKYLILVMMKTDLLHYLYES